MKKLLSKVPHELKCLGFIAMCITASYLLDFDMGNYFTMCIASWFASICLHMMGSAIKEPYIDSRRKLFEVIVMCFIPVLNVVAAVYIFIFAITSKSPDELRQLIRDLK